MRFWSCTLLVGLLTALVCQAGGPESHIWRRAHGEIGIQVRHPSLFSGPLEKLLDSGFELVLRYQLELREPGGQTLASHTQLVQAAHDLWNERYLIRHTPSQQPPLIFHQREAALRSMRQMVWTLPAPPPTVSSGHLRVVVHLQPAHPGQTERTRQWLRPPVSGATEDARGTNLFSSMAHLLVPPELEEDFQARYTLGPWTFSKISSTPPPSAEP